MNENIACPPELKPCPFCGSPALMIKTAAAHHWKRFSYKVQCGNLTHSACYLDYLLEYPLFPTLEAAALAWNSRPETAPRGAVKTASCFDCGGGVSAEAWN